MLTSAEQTYCLKLARHVLCDAVGPSKVRPVESYLTPEPPLGRLAERLPCFVSLHSRGAHRLRGCIGCLTSEESLLVNIYRLTQAAAFQDPRFRPVTEQEIGDLSLEISVLGPQLPLPSLDLVEIGRHGLQVRSRGQHGLLLAQVAAEFKWTREEFAQQTCLKAGLAPEYHAAYEWFYFEQISFSE